MPCQRFLEITAGLVRRCGFRANVQIEEIPTKLDYDKNAIQALILKTL